MKIFSIITVCVFSFFYNMSILWAEDIDAIKKALLNDPSFINNLSSRIDKKTIEDTLKDFLLHNPEFMLKVQDTLMQKEATQIQNERQQILSKAWPTIYNPKEDLLLGSAKAKHTIVEFLDFNCGYCKKTYNLAEQLVKTHPNIRIIVKELPILGVNSVHAHTVSRAFHQILPGKQAQLIHAVMSSTQPATKENLLNIAKSLGADSKKIESILADKDTVHKIQAYLLDNVKLAMSLKIQGTPAYIIDGQLIEGIVNLEDIGNKLDPIK